MCLLIPIWINEMQMLNWNDVRAAPDIYIDFTNPNSYIGGGEIESALMCMKSTKAVNFVHWKEK